MTTARWVIVAAVLAVGLAIAWTARPQPQTAAERVDRISAELRCPVCQGLSVQDSPSETARSMRALVAQRVAEGRTDDEIRAEFVRSYGDWILLEPPLLSVGGLVWLAPLAAIVLGAALAWSRARAPAPIAVVAGPTDEELGRLRELVASEPE
ncbi:MAG TPA: cytochrome c-type biogenesis protein CcmH [Candidatus Saccharimonadales bacterium]|jgi:cytochrome c-type biogenesis protein CcmH|nr:cytochrome c-type biogenesis protein CcmH [Candidatus Saccharimonadales bacterium]